jgi:DNA-binding NarL/FixJ family response regulator
LADQPIPDVLLLDLYLDGEISTQAIGKIKGLLPGVKIIIVTGHDDSESVRNTFQYHIDGYYVKGDASANLPDIIRNTILGGAYITPVAARIVIDALTERKDEDQSATLKHIRSKLPWSAPYRTLLVIEGLLSGKTYQEIGSALGLSLDGVRYYTRQIYKYLNINKRSQLNDFFE